MTDEIISGPNLDCESIMDSVPAPMDAGTYNLFLSFFLVSLYDCRIETLKRALHSLKRAVHTLKRADCRIETLKRAL